VTGGGDERCGGERVGGVGKGEGVRGMEVTEGGVSMGVGVRERRCWGG